MADKKPAPKPSGGGEGQMIFVAVVAVMIVFVILPTVATFFNVNTKEILPENPGKSVGRAFDSFVEIVSFISIFVSFVIILLIFYAKTQYKEITTNYGELIKGKENLQNRDVAAGAVFEPVGIQLPGSADFPQLGVVPAEPDPRWLEIVRHIESNNPSDWRVAILEADILLFDMLSQMGYSGTSIGEMLKQVEPQNFLTLDDAWRAHKIRNTIAHEGSSYELQRAEAERAIRLYENVFKEFYFI